LGIPADIPQHASYIEHWLGPLKKDKREIFRAAADAQRIVDMVLGFHPEFVMRQTASAQPARPLPRSVSRTGDAPKSGAAGLFKTVDSCDPWMIQ
jgi:hypothetical protein